MDEQRMDETRRVAHRLLDELPDRFVLEAKNLIGDLKLRAAGEFHATLSRAQDDDEPTSAEDVDAIERALSEHAKGHSRPWRDLPSAPVREHRAKR